MEILQAIKEAPEWVALVVALGGLTYQQRQINRMSKLLESTQTARVAFLESRMDRMFESLENVRRALMLKTDLDGQ